LLPSPSAQWLTQFKRAGYRTLGFDDQLCFALTHKESSGNEGYHGNEQEGDYRPTLQSFKAQLSLLRIDLFPARAVQPKNQLRERLAVYVRVSRL
jgi:hypothetical protein